MTDYIWQPAPAHIEQANVTRLARTHGLSSLTELRRRSVEDIGWYWDAVVRDLGLPFRKPYERVVDLSAGIERPEWFLGGELNIVDACLNRWAAGASAARPAVVHEAEDGTTRTLTYLELRQEAERVGRGLRSLGIGKGDAVALFMPMTPEAVIACYAVAGLGAVLVPLFSGFAPHAVASRLQDADAKAVIVADATVRRGREVAMRPVLDEALESCPTVEHVIVVGNVDDHPKVSLPRETLWSDLSAGVGEPGEAHDAETLSAADTLLLAYTSGTSGRPKGAVHTHAGFLVHIASMVAYSFDVGPDDVFCWITDMGWIMGPVSVFGAHANGATLVLYEGSPDVPDTNRLWSLVERHQVTMLGVSPTLIRTVRAGGRGAGSDADLSSVRTLGSTGEPWDPETYEWLARDVFGGRVPVINVSGGTEVGGAFLAPYPVEPIRSCSLGGPALGMDVDVVDDQARPVRGKVGELVCRQPWPSMTRSVWKDDSRYLEAYWSTFPGIWRHGDFALVDDGGQWFLLGRSDDVMNVAGKRLAPAEVEAILIGHPAVAEAAVVGVPDPKKGEAIWAFWVPRDGAHEDVSQQLRELVAAELGKPFTPGLVRGVSQLPKTRSAKILRRAVRAAAMGSDPGDLSSAENPDALDEIRAAVARSA
ncbi:AMP-binding protein [Streptomyces coeruleorubidus]|uniref:AMP-binding protein n=1 Tax=Streptomyces coeruleorubidus TaxID=116188 RepID=UPI0033B52858